MKCRPIRTLLWSLIVSFLTSVDHGNRSHYAKVVSQIDLHEDGQHFDVYFSDNGSYLCQDIRSLRLLNKSEMSNHFEEFKDRLSKTHEQLVPVHLFNPSINLEQIIYLPTLNVDIFSRIILNNVCNGHYIDCRGQYLNQKAQNNIDGSTKSIEGMSYKTKGSFFIDIDMGDDKENIKKE